MTHSDAMNTVSYRYHRISMYHVRNGNFWKRTKLFDFIYVTSHFNLKLSYSRSFYSAIAHNFNNFFLFSPVFWRKSIFQQKPSNLWKKGQMERPSFFLSFSLSHTLSQTLSLLSSLSVSSYNLLTSLPFLCFSLLSSLLSMTHNLSQTPSLPSPFSLLSSLLSMTHHLSLSLCLSIWSIDMWIFYHGRLILHPAHSTSSSPFLFRYCSIPHISGIVFIDEIDKLVSNSDYKVRFNLL